MIGFQVTDKNVENVFLRHSVDNKLKRVCLFYFWTHGQKWGRISKWI